ncbi:MAG: hypothetical protein ACYTFG_13845 [Planctomycetota bacterium]|jgi:hypothetical protein
MRSNRPRRLAALAGALLILLAFSCSDFSPDESFFWGPGGGAAAMTPDQMRQALINAGGGWAFSRWNTDTLDITVIDALTRNPIDSAEVIIGNGSNYFQTVTDGAGWVQVNFSTLGAVAADVITAGGPGYETLTIQHGGVYMYVLALRPNTLGAYTEVRGTVSNVTSTDYWKFEAALSTAVRPLDGEGTRLRRNGFNTNGTYLFYCEPNRPGDLSILEFNGTQPSNFVSEMTAGLGAGSLDTRVPALPGSPPTVFPMSGGVEFAFDRGTEIFGTYDPTTSRGRILGFRPDHFAPLVLSSGSIDTMQDRFFCYTVDPGGFDQYRAHMHLDGVMQNGGEIQGTCDVFWDLPDLVTASPQFVNVPSIPYVQNPQPGAKNLGPGPTFSWNPWGGDNDGFYEVEIKDRLKSFPENLVWRFWTPVDNAGTGGNYAVGSIDFPGTFTVKNLRFEKDYAWRLGRYRVPSQMQPTDPMYHGNLYRNASFINRTPWMPFVIDIAGEGPAQFISDTLDELHQEGGGVKGSRMNISNVWVRVIDEVTGGAIANAQVKIGTWTVDHRTANTSGELFYDISSTTADTPWVITACHPGYENTTFWDFNGHLVVIPLRPDNVTGYARVTGTANNFGPAPAWKGAVASIHAYERGLFEIGGEGQPFTMYVRANQTIHFTALVQNNGSLIDFDHAGLGPYFASQSAGHSPALSGTSLYPIVKIENGGQGTIQGLNTITSGNAYAQGLGLDAANPWESVTVGLGGTNTGSMFYGLDVARLPGVEELKTELRYAGDDQSWVTGNLLVTLPITDLGRALPPVYSPGFPSLSSPSNGSSGLTPDVWFDYSANAGQDGHTGLSVLTIRRSAISFPDDLKWRIFQWSWDFGNNFTLPTLGNPFDLTAATTYDWNVEQYFGEYHLDQPDASSASTNMGKWSLGFLKKHQEYKTESETWSFSTQ